MKAFKSHIPIRSVRGTVLLAGIFVLLAGIAWYAGWSDVTAKDAEETVSPGPAEHRANIPDGMVYVPGGETLVGNDLDEETYNPHHQSAAGPPFVAEVEPFYMRKHPVTVAEFRAFVEATGYETEAERFGNAGVLDLESGQWMLVDGATWERPLGPDEAPAPDDHPVTQVSWNDAVAYAEWAGERLPTEVEWEHAARGAENRRDRYAWGNELVVGGAHRANTWSSRPSSESGPDGSAEDEYLYTSPVGTFGETDLGLTDMGGNVWEWTQDWYRPYRMRGRPYRPTPQSTKVQRGGSFQCHEDMCHGYTVYARSHTTPETSLFHGGFRTVKDVE